MHKLFTLLTVCLLSAGWLGAQEIGNFAHSGPRPVVSPDIQGDSVSFRLKADYATLVQFKGSWTPVLPMTRTAGFVWEIKLPLPDPEIYTYHFLVDGVAVNDPQNILVQRDGTRYLPMLIVPGPRTENYVEAALHGTVSHPWYDSRILGISRRLTVYTPYGYEDNPKKKYPVLYLLHGAGGDEEAWISMGRTAQILDNLIEKGLAEPMIVVMPNGNPGQQAARTLHLPEKPLDRRDPAVRDSYVNSLCTEIVPFIEKHYRAIPKPASRAIAGLSMGGGHTIAASIRYPELFDYICPLSAAGDATPEQIATLRDAGVKLYFLACGNSDFLFQRAEALHATLEEQCLEHVYFVSEGGHTWANWRLYLNTFAPMLFK